MAYTLNSKWDSLAAAAVTSNAIDKWITDIASFASSAGLETTLVNPYMEIHTVSNGIYPGYHCNLNNDWYSVNVNGVLLGIIIDQVPAGCSPSVNVIQEVGFAPGQPVINKAVCDAILSALPSGSYAEVIEGTGGAGRRIFTKVDEVDNGYSGNVPQIVLGGSLATTVTRWRGSGYLIKTIPGALWPSNYLYMYLANADPEAMFPRVWVKSDKNPSLTKPMTDATGTSLTSTYIFAQATVLYGNPHMLLIVGTTDKSLSLSLFNLNLVNVGTTMTEAGYFGVGSGGSGNLRTSLKAFGSPTLVRVNGVERISAVGQDTGQPMLVVSRSASSYLGLENLWEDDSPMICEPWVTMLASVGDGQVVGQMYDAIIATRGYSDPDNTLFTWDLRLFRPITFN